MFLHLPSPALPLPHVLSLSPQYSLHLIKQHDQAFCGRAINTLTRWLRFGQPGWWQIPQREDPATDHAQLRHRPLPLLPAPNGVTAAGLLSPGFIKRVPPQASRPCLSKVVFLSSASVSIFHFFQKYCLLLLKTFYSGEISSIHKSRENSIVNDHDVTSTVINSYPILFLLYFPSLPRPPK